jgi:hypothetical protein
MTFQDLTNEEILFLYHENLDEYIRYQNIIDSKKVVDEIDLMGQGFISIGYDLTQDDLNALVKDRHYLFVASLHKKLELIASIITEADPSLAEKVNTTYQERL